MIHDVEVCGVGAKGLAGFSAMDAERQPTLLPPAPAFIRREYHRTAR